MTDHIAINRAYWDERVPYHVDSDFYDIDAFRRDRDCLRPFEVTEVGDVSGRELIHLQCHIGTDTLSWAHHGAQVTGLDFSSPAIVAAAQLAAEMNIDAYFVSGDVYSAPELLGGNRFDIVYTGIGALCWLPDITAWGQIVARLLRPGGFVYVADFHPFADCLDYETGTRVVNDYFDSTPQVHEAFGSYAAWTADTQHNTEVLFRHSIGDIVTALAKAGLRLDFLHEHDFTLFQRFESLRDNGDQTYRYPAEGTAAPLLFSLRATG